MKKMILSAALLLLASNAFAGGSALTRDIISHLPDDVRGVLVDEFVLADTGICVRLPSGERILPCEIQGISKFDSRNVIIEVTYSESGDAVFYVK